MIKNIIRFVLHTTYPSIPPKNVSLMMAAGRKKFKLKKIITIDQVVETIKIKCNNDNNN